MEKILVTVRDLLDLTISYDQTQLLLKNLPVMQIHIKEASIDFIMENDLTYIFKATTFEKGKIFSSLVDSLLSKFE